MNRVTPRRKFWAKVLFWYSCLSIVLCGVVHVVVALLGRPELLFDPDSMKVWWGLFSVHLLVYCLTFGWKHGGRWARYGGGEA